MRIGLQIPYFKFNGADIATKLAEVAKIADEGGFYSMWVMDHFFQLEGMIGPADDPMLEGYSTLTYLAGLTKNVKLGTLVTGVIYRQPGFLVKAVTTLDVLSGGRAYFGVGAGWYEREAKALGFPFPSTKDRFEWLEETLKITHQMWSDNNGKFEGTHFNLEETINSPQVISQPHPPIMIGGTGEKKTLRFVAQYGDACNIFEGIGMDEIARKLDILKGHCEDVGRDNAEIEKTTLGTANVGEGGSTPAEIIEHCRQLADIGIQHAIFNMPMNMHDITPLEIFAKEIIPAVSEF